MKCVILAGGSGTHLWPLSRKKFPKQFQKFGTYSLFQQAVLRCLKLTSIENILVVTNEDLKFYVAGQIQELNYNILWENVLIEPKEKNTLPAISFAIKIIQNQSTNPETVIIFPSDHVLSEEALTTIKEMIPKAASDYFILFGVKPSESNTNYGYMYGKEKTDEGILVSDFIEKPDELKAKQLIEEGYLWNSGIFLFNTETFFNELKKHTPDMFNLFQHYENITEIYGTVPSLSIDYGLIEKSTQLRMVPLKGTWKDVDDFSDLYHQLDKDSNKNVVHNCDVIPIDSKNDFIYSGKDKLVSLVDINDMVIIDSADALLIAPKESSKKVKQIVEELKQEKDDRVLLGRTVYRPWGFYTVLESRKNHVIKKITVFPNHTISLQLHYHRSEHWVVVNGTANVHVNGKDFFVRPGESTFIRIGEKHRLTNPSDTVPLEIIEVQLGEYVSEDDIVRFDDEYGRT